MILNIKKKGFKGKVATIREVAEIGISSQIQ